MANSRQGQIPSELGWLVDTIDGMQERLRRIEAPSGEALESTVAKLSALVSDIQAQLDAWALGRWTNDEILVQVANTINTRFTTAVSFGSNISVAGSATISGAIVGSNGLSVGGGISSPTTYSTDIGSLPGSHRTVWVKDSGLLGYASSSRDRKMDIQPANLDIDAILSVEPKSFYYTEAVRLLEEMPEDEREGLEPKLEYGFIAEELDELGLTPFVFYDKDGKPEGIEYSMLVVAQQAAIRDLAARLNRLEQAND